MPFLVIYHTSGVEEELEVVSQLTMGRLEVNDVILAEGGVSRRHARFYIDGDELWIEDLGSANGTLVDGERIHSPVCLNDKAQVQIGDCEIVVHLSKQAEVAESTQLKAATSPEWEDATVAPQNKAAAIVKRQAVQAQLVCVGEPEDGRSYELVGTCVVGRVPGTEIQIEDSSISRRHAEIVVRADGSIWLTDLGSANGTTVNDEPIHEPQVLSDGDVVCFGNVETRVQIAGSSAARKPRRNVLAKRPERSLAASRHNEEEEEEGEGEGEEEEAEEAKDKPRRKKLLWVVASIVVVFLLAAVGLKLMSPASTPGPSVPPPPPPPNEASELERALKGCRQYQQMVSCISPNYKHATEACRRALAIDPLHKEANSHMQKIALESECASHFEQGKQAVEFEPEKALVSFLKIDPACKEHVRCAIEPGKEARNKAENSAKKDCLEYTKIKSWRLAYEKCEFYINLICPQMPEEELYPPGGKKLVISAGTLKRDEWRPSNEYYRNFLMARSQIDPRAPTWRCPGGGRPPDVTGPPKPGTKEAEAKKWFAERLKQAELEQVMLSYYVGKTQDALSKLAVIRKDMKKVNLHEAANRMQVQIRQIDALFSEGMTLLEKASVEDAAERFQNALEKDKVFMLGEISGMSELEEKAALNNHLKSFFRNNVMVDMPNKCLGIGESWRKRNDLKRACQIWNVGYHFNKNNTDLLSSLGRYCTNHAHELLKKVSNCSQLQEILHYVVEGDGLRQRVEKLQTDNNCPR